METRTSKIVYDLSQDILRGELPPNATLVEEQLAARFSVSRTPIRQALSVLHDEGLLQKSGRSFRVRQFGPKEMLDAIEVRGVLEGLAAREVTEHKIGTRVVRELELCLSEAEEVIKAMESTGLDEDLVFQYFALNSRFHSTITHGAQNDALTGALEVVNRVPFVSAGTLARHKPKLGGKDEERELRYFVFGHMQHREITDAIRAGQGARAEKLMSEHAQLAVRNIDIPVNDSLALDNAMRVARRLEE